MSAHPKWKKERMSHDMRVPSIHFVRELRGWSGNYYFYYPLHGIPGLLRYFGGYIKILKKFLEIPPNTVITQECFLPHGLYPSHTSAVTVTGWGVDRVLEVGNTHGKFLTWLIIHYLKVSQVREFTRYHRFPWINSRKRYYQIISLLPV